MSLAIQLIGFLGFVAAVGLALVIAGMPHVYVVVAVIILVAIGIRSGPAGTRVNSSGH